MNLTELALPIATIMVALVLVVLSGANDGGVISALGIRFAVIEYGWLLLIMAGALVAVPLLLGTAVADTLAAGLIDTSVPGSGWVFLVGVAAGLATVLVLGRLGLPTSITLALIGGLAGAALGAGAAFDWARVGRVLLIGAAAPAVGLLLGMLIERLARVVLVRGSGRLLRVLQVVGFVLLCGAYAANDGQKMLAVAAIALAGLPTSSDLPAAPMILAPDQVGPRAAVLAGCAALFCTGLLWRLRRVSRRIGFDLAQVRPVDAVAAEFAGSTAVVTSSAFGAPVSLTQALAGGLVGASGSAGLRRVRWAAAGRIGAAWLVTLPASAVAAAVLALPLRLIG